MGIVADMGVTVELGQWLSTGYMLMPGLLPKLSRGFQTLQRKAAYASVWGFRGSLYVPGCALLRVLLAGRILQAVSPASFCCS